MEAVLVVQPVEGEPSVIYSACADGHVLRWELDADLNADSYRSAASHLFFLLNQWVLMVLTRIWTTLAHLHNLVGWLKMQTLLWSSHDRAYWTWHTLMIAGIDV